MKNLLAILKIFVLAAVMIIPAKVSAVDYRSVDVTYLKGIVGDGSILLKDVKSANIVSDKKIIWTVSGKNVVFSTDNGGTVTIKNGKNKKITVDDVTKKYSANSSGLFAENNFVTADNLSQLVENNSVGEFEFNSSEKTSQENLITYAEK